MTAKELFDKVYAQAKDMGMNYKNEGHQIKNPKGNTIVRKNLEEKDLAKAKENMVYVEDNLQRLLSVEYNILFARSLEILSEEDWI